MVINVGVIGTGMIGTAHIDSLAHHVGGARVRAVFDVDADRAGDVAASVGATATASASDIVHADDVDAVLIATPGFTHADIVLDCLEAAKPTLCEKPLATFAADCVKVLEAEVAVGRRLVQVGFMRRFDPGYEQVREAITSGAIGQPLMAHMFHRNPDVPPSFGDEMVMNDAFIHEIDVTRWLFDDEVAAVRVLAGRPSPHAHEGLHDPQVLVFELASGALVLAEAFVANGFGYDVRCEVVGSDGTVELTTPRLSTSTGTNARSERIPDGWKERFGQTYRRELKAWVDAVAAGTHVGPSSWDGYAATVIADAGVEAQRLLGDRVVVSMIDRPDLYARGERPTGEDRT